MTTVPVRPRRVCPDCGAAHRAQPLEVQIHATYRAQGVWEYRVRPLCPACQRAQLDYWNVDRRTN